MHHTLSLAAQVLALASLVTARVTTYAGYEFGNKFYLGPTTGGQYITKATYSMVVPKTPADYRQAGSDQTWLSLWIGMQGNPTKANVLNMDFVQPLLNWAPNNKQFGCAAPIDQWCVQASTYLGGSTGTQQSTPYVVVPKSSDIDFEVSLNSSTTMLDQKVWVNGQLVSMQSNAAGMKPAVFYSGNECYAGGCGTVDAYDWANITITLNQADAHFDSTLTLTGATSSGMKTQDGGKTWTIDHITIAQDLLTS